MNIIYPIRTANSMDATTVGSFLKTGTYMESSLNALLEFHQDN